VEEMLVTWSKVALLATAVCASPLGTLHNDRESQAQDAGSSEKRSQSSPDAKALKDTIRALRVMQEEFFEPWIGTWPTAIDWTAAVMGTHVIAAIESLSGSLEILPSKLLDPKDDRFYKENVISSYFTQVVGFYFGQDALSLRNQAFDDMLWVVLGWLDTVQFIETHSKSLFDTSSPPFNRTWHGSIWTRAFAHRARVFWDLASAGWDTKLCGGGMDWNPRLLPYKNAITNELWIAGSIHMYLHFPGDSNTSPFGTNPNPNTNKSEHQTTDWAPRDFKYLRAALEGYRWLTSSNFTNDQGLYIDGFHVSNLDQGGTKCDQRDEMVYTYNQGVVLSGQLGLFRATGKLSYLDEGHKLIENVIRATGYDLKKNKPVDNISTVFNKEELPPWRGLGRAGILEEACDATATCSQDSQAFKGIWMHHFTTFCSPLQPPPNPLNPANPVFKEARRSQAVRCLRYLGWIKHNADAARGTRDADGKFGMWWTPGLWNSTNTVSFHLTNDSLPHTPGATDYRNHGVPQDPTWISMQVFPEASEHQGDDGGIRAISHPQQPLGLTQKRKETNTTTVAGDPNVRGRGRTVETQGGGVAVLRALWELSKQTF